MQSNLKQPNTMQSDPTCEILIQVDQSNPMLTNIIQFNAI